jgi:hypothetical protein
MTPPLLAAVVSVLGRAGIPCALIGAAALAVRGVARSTFDLDLLTTDVRALDPDAWRSLSAAGVSVAVRRGDAADPLAGVVRIDSPGERTVDVIVGRGGWQEAVTGRAEPIVIEGATIPVARASDLILLKLYAGGSQDAWDIEQLLATGDRDTLVAAVNADLDVLPPDARARWRRLAG